MQLSKPPLCSPPRVCFIPLQRGEKDTVREREGVFLERFCPYVFPSPRIPSSRSLSLFFSYPRAEAWGLGMLAPSSSYTNFEISSSRNNFSSSLSLFLAFVPFLSSLSFSLFGASAACVGRKRTKNRRGNQMGKREKNLITSLPPPRAPLIRAPPRRTNNPDQKKHRRLGPWPLFSSPGIPTTPARKRAFFFISPPPPPAPILNTPLQRDGEKEKETAERRRGKKYEIKKESMWL